MRRTRRIFLASLGLTALVAVGSYWWQFPGLAGPNGIAPISEAMNGLRASSLGFFDVPTLLWISSSNGFVHMLLALSMLSALALVLGVAPRAAAVTLWASWASIVQVGQPFLAFQWDILLSETAFLAAFYAPGVWRLGREDEPEPHHAMQLLMAALACKVTLESGVVKLMGGDPAWRDLTALTFHWWTQPLPTWTSVLAARLPLFIQQAMCAVMFVLELLFPLFLFGPRKLRVVGALGLMALQLGLIAAGNYSFYNWLTLILSIPCLPLPPQGRGSGRGENLLFVIPALYVALSAALFLSRNPALNPIRRFDTINTYGAFARMTKTRPEILLEYSDDFFTWTPYVFPYKPGPLDRRPGFIAPWQPRLDWQMWFAALGDCQSNPWVFSLQHHLLKGTPEVLALFESVPPKPPKYLRTVIWEYRFAPSGSPDWWTRTDPRPYCPELTLSANGSLGAVY